MAKSKHVSDDQLREADEADLQPSIPNFHLVFENTENNVAVDERSAFFRLILTTTNVDWNAFRLENVTILFNTGKLPERITVNGQARTEVPGWFTLTEPFDVDSSDPVVKRVEIKTGFFAAIQIAESATTGKRFIEANRQTLLDHPPAEEGLEIELDTVVQCVFRRLTEPGAVTYGTDGKLEFAVDVD